MAGGADLIELAVQGAVGGRTSPTAYEGHDHLSQLIGARLEQRFATVDAESSLGGALSAVNAGGERIQIDRHGITFVRVHASTGIHPRLVTRNPPARVRRRVRVGGLCISERRFNAVGLKTSVPGRRPNPA